jgi:glycerol-3-phosphate acyltransferase PlsY
MMPKGLLWMLGAYLLGTLPSTYLVSRARRGNDVLRHALRNESEGDAHILMRKYLGKTWATVAAVLDVGKGFAAPLAVREIAGLSARWVAVAGVLVVVGHGWPPYARALAGRGLSTASGVLLAILPIAMAIAGVLILVGIVLRYTGIASTAGLALAPGVAALQGQPGAYVAMAVAILAAVMLRRLVGIGEAVRAGTPWAQAFYWRAVHDLSSPPKGRKG